MSVDEGSKYKGRKWVWMKMSMRIFTLKMKE